MDYKELKISKLLSVRWSVSRKMLEMELGVHVTEDLERHARKFGHYYKQRVPPWNYHQGRE